MSIVGEIINLPFSGYAEHYVAAIYYELASNKVLPQAGSYKSPSDSQRQNNGKCKWFIFYAVYWECTFLSKNKKIK